MISAFTAGHRLIPAENRRRTVRTFPDTKEALPEGTASFSDGTPGAPAESRERSEAGKMTAGTENIRWVGLSLIRKFTPNHDNEYQPTRRKRV